VDKRERLRLTLTHEVARLLRQPSVRAALPVLAAGESPFIVGLDDDTMRDLRRRVMALGGAAHLVVLTPLASGKNRMKVLLFEESAHKEIAELDGVKECAVSEDSTLGMLMEVISVGQEVRTFYAYDSETMIRFLTDSVQPPVAV
jgi:hypothetical protein